MAQEIRTCPDCHGSGTASVAFKCNTCGGSGEVWYDTGQHRITGQSKKR